MKTENMTPNEIRKLGIEALSRALGPIGMARFIQQFDKGSGNYTAERGKWLDDLRLDDMVEEIKARETQARKSEKP